MTWTYEAGSATPGPSGLFELPSLRLTDDGSFCPLAIPPLFTSPPIRDSVTPMASDHGGRFGLALYDPFPFEVTGWFLCAEDLSDLGEIVDYLKDKANLRHHSQTVLLNLPGWAEARQMTVRVTGQISIVQPERSDALVSEREFTIPLTAADPLKYSTTEHTVTVTSGTSVVNAGDADTPVTVRFNGPVTNPQVDKAGTSGSDRIKLLNADGSDVVIASGHYIDVSTNPAGDGGISAVDDTGASVYDKVAAFTVSAQPLWSGSTSWTKTVDAGAGAVQFIYRDAWS